MKSIIFLMLLLSQTLAYAQVQELNLGKFTGRSNLTLRCTGDEQSLDFPVADRWNVKNVSMNLHYISSINLVGTRSQLVVKLNGMPIAQTKLLASAPDVLVQLKLPVDYLRTGYNRISFGVAQHAEYEGCEHYCAPDLWTTVDLQKSSLAFEVDERELAPNLSSIKKIFDSKLIAQAKVHIVVDQADQESLKAAAVAASGISHHFDYQPVNYSVSDAIKPGMDNVLVGKRAFVERFAALEKSSATDPERSGQLALMHLPIDQDKVDKQRALIVVTGATENAVKVAAQTLAAMDTFPGIPSMDVEEFKVPFIRAYNGREMIQPKQEYTFKALNFATTTFRGVNSSSKDITFQIPPDMTVRPNFVTKLRLHLAYGAGMRTTSAINILVNDTIVRAVSLNKPEGGVYNNYEIEIPTRIFQPGLNRITFQTELHPPLKECDLAMLGNLFVTVFEDSSLTFPDMPRYVEMPKLELFALSGFPFTRWSDGSDSRFVLVEKNPETMNAAFNMIGLISQRSGFPMFNLDIGTTIPGQFQGDLVLFGSPDAISSALQGVELPFMKQKSTVTYQIVHDWATSPVYVQNVQSGGLGSKQGYLYEFESPYQAGRSVLAVAAQDGDSLNQLTQTLLQSRNQVLLKGGLALVDFSAEDDDAVTVKTYPGLKTYTTNKTGSESWINSFLHKYPWTFYIVVAILTIVIFTLLALALRRFRRNRIKAEIEQL